MEKGKRCEEYCYSVVGWSFKIGQQFMYKEMLLTRNEQKNIKETKYA